MQLLLPILQCLTFFLSVSDNRKGLGHKLIFLDELLTLHASQLVSQPQCLHTVFWGVPDKYSKAVPEVPSGGSLDQICSMTVSPWTSLLQQSLPGHLATQLFQMYTKHSGDLHSLLWAGRNAGVGLCAHAVAIPRTVKVSQCLVKCHYMIIWWPVSPELREVPGLGHGPGWELPSVSLLCSGWLRCPMPAWRSPTLCWAAGHASTVSPLHFNVMLAQDLQGVCPPPSPQGFQEGRKG